MDTFYGHHWELRYEEGAQNLAYSALALSWHQDLLYFEAPPGVQLLHCLVQADLGGETIFLDGVSAAEEFERQHKVRLLQRATDSLKQQYERRNMNCCRKSGFHITTVPWG